MAPSSKSTPAMMRIAIAGGGGLAWALAEAISETPHALVVLTRSAEIRASFDEFGCDVMEVDYNSQSSLRYALRGADLVLSTVKGQPQLNLIRAAKHEMISRFVPAEWEGALSHRSGTEDARDPGSQDALSALRDASRSSRHPMNYTVFSCGLFYEWFAPGGLSVYQVASEDTYCNFQGALFIEGESMAATITENNAEGRTVRVSMTSISDVGRFVAAALDLGIASWEKEYKMRGTQMSVRDIVATFGRVRNGMLQHPINTLCIPLNHKADTTLHKIATTDIRYIRYQDLSRFVNSSIQSQDYGMYFLYRRLKNAADGRWHFGSSNLTTALTNNHLMTFEPIAFDAFLESSWGPYS
ncbi:isoflavone reductase family protein [Zalerion maritima]|uniref:Isoflavone reductase family protein n=1 Tax=Zalerion maritima TaxID=339359 RepID=A0AAD5WP84_9PEZI|nr:isoflavone reductase family protein [Zalerion maritima]